MELKKNDRVMYNNRLGTVVSDVGYYKVTEKESYIDVQLDGEEYSCPIRKNCLRKVNTYDTLHRFEGREVPNGFNINNLYNLKIYENMKTSTMFNKLEEEVKEVMLGLINNNTENIAEELLDVMQVCLGIAYTKNINLNNYIEKHNNKLMMRGHESL